MLFSSIVRWKSPYQSGSWAFCIDLTPEMMEYVRRQWDWLHANPDAIAAEFAIDKSRSRFMERRDLYEMLDFDPDPLCGEDPLDYYGLMMDYGRPNQEYWDDQLDIPEDVRLHLGRNWVSFKFSRKVSYCDGQGVSERYEHLETDGMMWTDFFQQR